MGEGTFDAWEVIRSASSGRALSAQWVLSSMNALDSSYSQLAAVTVGRQVLLEPPRDSMNALDSSYSHSAVTVGKRLLLEPPKDLFLSGPCQHSHTRNFDFSSSEESSVFCKAVMEEGWSVIFKLESNKMIDLGASFKGSDHQSMEGRTGGKVRSSRITRCVYIPKKSFQIPVHSMRLCDAALAAARKVGSLSDAWTFLNTYGSHVSCSLYHLGGIFLEEHDKVSKEGTSSEDQHSSSSNENGGNASASVSAFSLSASVSGDVCRNSSESGESKNENTSGLKKRSKEVITVGPTNVRDEAAFRRELEENPLSWSIIDKAVDTQEDLVGVWDIILEKHAAIKPDDNDDDVAATKKLERAALCLCQAWLIAASSRGITPELNGLIERGNKLLRQLAPSAPPLPAVLPQLCLSSSTGCCRKAHFELQSVEYSSYKELQDALATVPRAEVGKQYLQVFETLKGTLRQETAKTMAAQTQSMREPSASSTSATDFHASLENGVQDVVDIQSKELQNKILGRNCLSKWEVQETQNCGRFCNNLQESYRSRVSDMVHDDGELKFEAAVRQYEMQMKDEIVQKFHSKEGSSPLPNVESCMSKEEQKAARDKLFGDIFDKILWEANQSHPPLAEQVPRKVDEAYERTGIAEQFDLSVREPPSTVALANQSHRPPLPEQVPRKVLEAYERTGIAKEFDLSVREPPSRVALLPSAVALLPSTVPLLPAAVTLFLAVMKVRREVMKARQACFLSAFLQWGGQKLFDEKVQEMVKARQEVMKAGQAFFSSAFLQRGGQKFDEKVQEMVKECIDRSLKDAKQYSEVLVENVILQTKDILINHNCSNIHAQGEGHSYAKETLTRAMQEIQRRWDQKYNITEKLRASKPQLRGFFEACADHDGQLGATKMLISEVQLLMVEEELVGDHHGVLLRGLANYSLSKHGWLRDGKKMRACLDLHLLTLMDNIKMKRNCTTTTRNVEKLLNFVRDGSAHYETVMNALIRKEVTKGLATIYIHSSSVMRGRSDSMQKVAMCCNPSENELQEIVVPKVREMMEQASENARPRCARSCPLCGMTCNLSRGHSGRHESVHQMAGLAGWRRIKSEEIWRWSCYESMVKGETFLHEGTVYNYNETELVFPDWKKPEAVLDTHSLQVQEYIFYNHHDSLVKRYGMKPCTEMPTTYNHDIQMLHTTLRNVLQDDNYAILRETFEESIRNNTI